MIEESGDSKHEASAGDFMATNPQPPASVQDLNNGSEQLQLASLVRELRVECERLRHELALAEAERDLYYKAIHSDPRGMQLLANLDIADFEKCSAGLVEPLTN